MCGQHSVQFGIKNTRLQTGTNTWRRGGRLRKILNENWLKEKDPGSEGWTMFWKPETYETEEIERDKITSILHTQRRGGKRTKKRALKKRHQKKTKKRVKRKKKTRRKKMKRY